MSLSSLQPEPGAAGEQTEAAEQMIAAIRRYAAQVTADQAYFPIVPENTLNATDAMIVATALLKAVNVQVFELGLWQAFGS